MSTTVKYLSNKATEAEIADHLARCDTDFVPPLSSRVEINDYAQKITSKATRLEAWSGGTLIGLVAIYCNDKKSRIAYITSVSVLHEWMCKGIAANLMKQGIEHAKMSGMQQISLEVASDNTTAIKLYEKSGFIVGEVADAFTTMNLYLKSGEEHGQ